MLLGEHDLYTDTEAASVRADVAELLIHPQYEADTNNYDVALVSGGGDMTGPLGSLLLTAASSFPYLSPCFTRIVIIRKWPGKALWATMYIAIVLTNIHLQEII